MKPEQSANGRSRPAGDRPKKRWRRSAYVLVTISVATCAALVLAELLVRWTNPFGVRVRGGEIRLPRNVRFELENDLLPGVRRHLVHSKNSLGFRGPEPPVDWQRRLRVICVGGSTTECLYLSDGRDWPALLAARLQPQFPRLWLNNAGLDGHSTFGHLLLLRQHVLALKPHVLVLTVGMNDTSRDDLNEFDQRLLRSGAAVPDGWLERRALAALVQGLWRQTTAAQRGLYHRWVSPAHLPEAETYESIYQQLVAGDERSLAGYDARLHEISRLGDQHGVDLLLITQPALYGLRGTIDPETGVDLGRIAVHEGISGEVKWRFLERYNDVLRQLATEKQLPLVDAAATMPKDSRLYYDLIHFNEQGAAELAARVAPVLASHLQRKYPDHLQ